MNKSYDIRLVALDLDGTVFNSQKQITERTSKAICKAIEKGVCVVPATGRPVGGVPKAFSDIPGVRYAVVCNGASVIDMKTQETIFRCAMPNALAVEIMEILSEYNCLPEFYYGSSCYSDKNKFHIAHACNFPQAFMDYMISTRTFVDNTTEYLRTQKWDTEKLNILFDDLGIKQAVYERLKDDPRIAVTSSLAHNLEVNLYNANKGNALEALGKHLGLTTDQIMACGDSGNDLEMMHKVGLPIAMGNADQPIKNAASYTTLTNDEDGVAYAIEKFILNT